VEALIGVGREREPSRDDLGCPCRYDVAFSFVSFEIEPVQSCEQRRAVETSRYDEHGSVGSVGNAGANSLKHVRLSRTVGGSSSAVGKPRVKTEGVAALQEGGDLEVRIDLEQRVPKRTPVIDSESSRQLGCVRRASEPAVGVAIGRVIERCDLGPRQIDELAG